MLPCPAAGCKVCNAALSHVEKQPQTPTCARVQLTSAATRRRALGPKRLTSALSSGVIALCHCLSQAASDPTSGYMRVCPLRSPPCHCLLPTHACRWGHDAMTPAGRAAITCEGASSIPNDALLHAQPALCARVAGPGTAAGKPCQCAHLARALQVACVCCIGSHGRLYSWPCDAAGYGMQGARQAEQRTVKVQAGELGCILIASGKACMHVQVSLAQPSLGTLR